MAAERRETAARRRPRRPSPKNCRDRRSQWSPTRRPRPDRRLPRRGIRTVAGCKRCNATSRCSHSLQRPRRTIGDANKLFAGGAERVEHRLDQLGTIFRQDAEAIARFVGHTRIEQIEDHMARVFRSIEMGKANAFDEPGTNGIVSPAERRSRGSSPREFGPLPAQAAAIDRWRPPVQWKDRFVRRPVARVPNHARRSVFSTLLPCRCRRECNASDRARRRGQSPPNRSCTNSRRRRNRAAPSRPSSGARSVCPSANVNRSGSDSAGSCQGNVSSAATGGGATGSRQSAPVPRRRQLPLVHSSCGRCRSSSAKYAGEKTVQPGALLRTEKAPTRELWERS